jgi:signal transduction histidine kinase
MLRNRTFRRFVGLFFLLAAAAVVAGFIISTAAGILAASCAAVFGALFFVFTKVRYRSIARLSDQIDRVLHHADRLNIIESDEGELSILQSEITKMTLRIREQNDALKQEKQRLADSLADIAHQLRTPLTSANLIVSLLEKTPGESERKVLLREAEALFIRMDWLLDCLLKLSRLDAGIVAMRNEPIEVHTLLDSALRPLLISMELHDIRVVMDSPDGMCLQGDPGWLSEAIQNILKNCMESTGDHGCIRIACADNPLFSEIAIRDSGAGFADEDLPRLFDRFYRGKNTSASGYGIGLALCRMIIVRQGGTISAKNHPQGGAVFTLRFPK